MTGEFRAPGLDVQWHNDRWWVYYHRPCCPWSLGASSERFEPHPFGAISQVMEMAQQPCFCSICKQRLPLVGGGA